MKKCIFFISFLAICGLAISQESEIDFERKYFSIGINGGVGYNLNGYRLMVDKEGFTYYDINPHASFGLNGSIYITQKMRGRLEARYQKIEYGMNWPEKFTHQYDYTETTLSTLGFNAYFDYSLIQKNKFELFVSPGLASEIVVKDKYKTYLAGDDEGETNSKYYNVFTDAYRKKVAGASFSLLAKYNVFEFIDITLSPSYTYFFKGFVIPNDKPYQRLNLNLGLEVTF